MPVRLRIALLFAIVMGLVLAGAGAFVSSRLRSELRATIDSALAARSAVLLRDVEEEVEDVGRGDGVLDEADEIAQILDPSGRVLETTAALGPQPLLSPSDISNIGNDRSMDSTVTLQGRQRDVRLQSTRASNGMVVVVGTSTEQSDAALATVTRLLWIGGPAVLVLSGFAVWLLAGAALKPVERLRSEAEALSFGIDGRRLAVPATRDEIERLAETLNQMLARLEEALERERRFVDDASHELRTPLAKLKVELELALRRARSPAELERSIRSAAEEVDHLVRLAEHLLILARSDRGVLPTNRTRTDVRQLIDQLCAGFEQRASEKSVRLRIEAPDTVWASVDPLLTRQAIANLVENALAHTPAGGEVSVDISRNDAVTRIVVSDSGPGFDTTVLPAVFEPFMHADGGRGASAGTGLGLSIVRAIASAHGGTAEAQNRPEGGAAVVLTLPSP